MTVIEMVRQAWPKRQSEAQEAYAIFVDYCHGVKPPRVPGMDTVLRLAVRIDRHAYTPEEAAGREYLYRWHLALQSRIFGVPHALGM